MFNFCAFPLQKGEADAISLDGGFVYTAGMCGLVPVMAESYEGKHSSVSGSRWWGMGWCPFILESYKAAAVLHPAEITQYPALEGTHQDHQPNSWPCTDTPTIPPCAGSVIQMLLELWQSWGSAHSLGSLGSAQHPLGEEPFLISSLP